MPDMESVFPFSSRRFSYMYETEFSSPVQSCAKANILKI